MKTMIIALAATVMAAGTAFAAENSSFSDGNGFERGVQAAQLDFEPTASIGGGNDIRIDRTFKGGREVIERFTINPDGTRNVLSKSYGSSNS